MIFELTYNIIPYMFNEALQHPALQIAEKEIPFKWYESIEENSKWVDGAKIAGLLISVTACTVSITIKNPYPWHLHLIATGLYALSELTDTASTAIGLNAANRASKAGIQHDYCETNQSLSHVKTSRDLLYDPRNYIYPLLHLTATGILPGLIFPAGFIKTICTLNNLRVARRLNLATEIAQNEVRT